PSTSAISVLTAELDPLPWTLLLLIAVTKRLSAQRKHDVDRPGGGRQPCREPARHRAVVKPWDAHLAPEPSSLERRVGSAGEDVRELGGTISGGLRRRMWVVEEAADQLERDRGREDPGHGAAHIASQVECDGNGGRWPDAHLADRGHDGF